MHRRGRESCIILGERKAFTRRDILGEIEEVKEEGVYARREEGILERERHPALY